MGNTLDFLSPLIALLIKIIHNKSVPSFEEIQEFDYAVPDPTQIMKPLNRTHDFISCKYRNEPHKLDSFLHQGCDTLWKNFKKSVWNTPNSPFLGRRKVIKTGHTFRNNENFAKTKQGNYEWLTFYEVDEIVEAFSRTLIYRQLCPVIPSNVEGTPDLKFIGIFSENRREWYMTELSACSDSIVTVPIAVEQQFLNEDRVCRIIDCTGMRTLCVSSNTIGQIMDLKSKGKLPELDNIVLYDTVQDVHVTLATQVGLNLFSFYGLVDEGYKIFDVEKEEPKQDTVMFLGVTSGTTGLPKIVMLTHKNFISGQVCADFLGFSFTKDDVYLSYVPLSHVQEQICHCDAVMFGFRIGYSSGNMQNLINDIQMLQPTFFGSFPMFFNKLYERVNQKINEYPAPISNLIFSAIESKKWYFHNFGIFNHYLYDIIVFSFMRKVLGGRIRIMVSGGAPLSSEVKYFLTVVFCSPIFEAYGMTEAAGCCSTTAYWERRGGHVGGILPCLRMHLRDIKELNCVTDAEQPQGELYIKGNSVMKGYFKDPERTKEVLDSDGWLRIGDLAILLPNGAFQIIERV